MRVNAFDSLGLEMPGTVGLHVITQPSPKRRKAVLDYPMGGELQAQLKVIG